MKPCVNWVFQNNFDAMWSKISVLFLRGISIGSRFALSFLFVKYVSLEFQGEYTLMATTITIAMTIVGFDFYVYSNRYLIQNKSKINFTIYNQFAFHFITYSILLLLFLIFRSFFPTSEIFTITLLLLLLLEHAGMEFFRLFIAIERPVIANVVLFVRTGTWPIFIIYLMLVQKEIITLDLIINSWLVAAIIAIMLSVILLRSNFGQMKFKLDTKWIFSGLSVASLFFISTIAQKGIEFSDRFIINAYLGTKELGIYSFFFQLGNVANVAIYTMFISFMYPVIISSIGEKKRDKVKRVILRLRRSIILFVVIYGIIIFISLPFILEIMGKPELNKHQFLLLFFLLGNLFFNLSFTSHYALMAIHKDKQLMVITISISIINLILNVFAVHWFGILGSVVVFCLSSFLLFLVKGRYEKRYFKVYSWRTYD